MIVYIGDPKLEEEILEQRRLSGADRFDEVWDGVYFKAPLPNNEHQDIDGDLVSIFRIALGWNQQARVNPGVNVSDREVDWQENYRCPDVAVFLADTWAFGTTAPDGSLTVPDSVAPAT